MRASSSSRGAATPASARSTGCGTPWSTAGRAGSSSRSTRMRAWRPRTPPARRTFRSASSAGTAAATCRTHPRRDGYVPVHRRGARGGTGAPAGRRHRACPAGRPARQRPAVGDPRRPEGSGARLAADDRRRSRKRSTSSTPVPRAVVLPAWVLDAVCVEPGGARPSYAHGYYDRGQRLLPRVGLDQPRPRRLPRLDGRARTRHGDGDRIGRVTATPPTR